MIFAESKIVIIKQIVGFRIAVKVFTD